MTNNYLDEINNLILALEVEKFDHLASQLKTVVASASTTAELLMGVRFYLFQMPKGADSPSPSTQLKIESLAKKIDAILNRSADS